MLFKSCLFRNPLSQQPPLPYNFFHLSVLATEQLSGSSDNERNPICQHPQTIYFFLGKCGGAYEMSLKSFHFLNHFKAKSSYWICSFFSFLPFFDKPAYRIDFQFCLVISFIILKNCDLPALIFCHSLCGFIKKKVKDIFSRHGINSKLCGGLQVGLPNGWFERVEICNCGCVGCQKIVDSLQSKVFEYSAQPN